MSNVPEQVRRQAERANELLNQANGTPGDPPAEPVIQEPQVQEPAEPPAPEPTPAATPAEPTPAPAPAAPSDDWQQKYRTLQGVFSAEQGRWNAEKKVFETRITALESAAAAQPAPAPAAPAPKFDEKDIETYGPELMEMVSRQAQAMASQIIEQRMAELKPQLEQTREQVTNVATHVYRSNEEKFYGELAKEVPDWEAVNTDQRWLNWLAEVDPLSGVARQVYLDNASQKLDHTRVTTLFKAFKDAAGLTKPAPQAPAAPVLSPSPRTVGNASAPTHREPTTGVTRSEIAAHYRRGATDRDYRDSAEHKAFELRIQQAVATDQVVEA